jgi:Kef-type K+ transport system membrane component KefB
MHATLNMLLPLAGILIRAMAAAQLSQRFGLLAVFGQLLLGLLIGSTLLGWLKPNEIFQLFADIGVILLMFMAGLETDNDRDEACRQGLDAHRSQGHGGATRQYRGGDRRPGIRRAW